MIHDIGVELGAYLKSQGCPFPVVDGPEPTHTTTFARERIVIEHDENGDQFGPSRSQHVNPNHRMTRKIGGKITIYAQSGASGALLFEHTNRAEAVLDLVLVGMDLVARRRHNEWTPTAGKFVPPADLEKSESAGGAVYDLRFLFDRGVRAQTWAGAFRPEGNVSAVNSKTNVSVAGFDEDHAETACGA